MDKPQFLELFGSVFEHSPWIAETVFDGEMGAVHDHAPGLFAAMAQVFRRASDKDRMDVLLAHPDLAGKLAAAGRLTEASTEEQSSAGLDMLTDEERERFTALNTAYRDRFGFPFIIAVKGLNKADILAAFERRIDNNTDNEFATACREVEKIARLRLDAILPQ